MCQFCKPPLVTLHIVMKTPKLITIPIAVLSVLYLSLAFAANDLGLDKSTDEFTGTSTCQQLVMNSAGELTGLALAKADNTLVIGIVREIGRYEDATFNMFGVLRGDKVFVRFPATDEVLEIVPDDVSVDLGSHEIAAITGNHELLSKLLSSPTEVRVRFHSGGSSKDFTINHDVILTLAAGFGAECL